MMLRKLALIAAFVVTPAVAQKVDPTIHWCDGCTVERESASVIPLSENIGRYAYYVGNLPERTLHKYVVDRHSGKPECPKPNSCVPMSVGHVSKDGTVTPDAATEVDVYTVEVEGDIAEAFNNAMGFYYTDPIGWQKQYDVQLVDPTNPQSFTYKKFYRDGKFVPQANPVGYIGPFQVVPVVDFPDPNATVYDVAVIGAKQNQFLDYFLSPGGQQFQVASNYMLKVFSFVRLFDSDKLPATAINVTFADGSKVRITLDTRTTSPHYVIDEGSGRDSHGNFVPIRQTQLEGVRSEFSFRGDGNPNDRPNSYRQLSGLGVDMGGVPQNSESWTCGPNPNGTSGVTCIQAR